MKNRKTHSGISCYISTFIASLLITLYFCFDYKFSRNWIGFANALFLFTMLFFISFYKDILSIFHPIESFAKCGRWSAYAIGLAIFVSVFEALLLFIVAKYGHTKFYPPYAFCVLITIYNLIIALLDILECRGEKSRRLFFFLLMVFCKKDNRLKTDCS
jgi:hypothetical protein